MAARSPSSVCVGGIRMSTIATSGLRALDQLEQRVAVAGEPDDLEAGFLEQPGEAFAQDHRVVGQRYAHGISARSVVPRPGGLETVKRPPSASTRSASPRRPEPPAVRGAADAVVGDLDRQAPAVVGGGHADLAAVRVLGGVRERLAGHEVGGALDLVGEPPVERQLEVRRAARRGGTARRAPPPARAR